MSQNPYYAPQGGHPAQSQLLTGRAVFTTAYAGAPERGHAGYCYKLYCRFWEKTRCWIIARPLSGFAGNFFTIHNGSGAGGWQHAS